MQQQQQQQQVLQYQNNKRKRKKKQQVLNVISSLEDIDLSKLIKSISKRKTQKEVSEREQREDSEESKVEATSPQKRKKNTVNTVNTVLEVYRYSGAILKHMEEKILEIFQSDLLQSNKKVVLTDNKDTRLYSTNDQADRSDDNLDHTITKFHDLISTTNVYRILKIDLGLVNFPVKFDTKFLFTLKQNFSKFFESRKKITAVPNDPDAQIIFHAAP